MGNAGREMGMYRLLILSQRDVLGQKWQRLSFAACKHIVYPNLRPLIASVALPGTRCGDLDALGCEFSVPLEKLLILIGYILVS